MHVPGEEWRSACLERLFLAPVCQRHSAQDAQILDRLRIMGPLLLPRIARSSPAFLPLVFTLLSTPAIAMSNGIGVCAASPYI